LLSVRCILSLFILVIVLAIVRDIFLFLHGGFKHEVQL
jgi:hypothetical protein